MISKNAPRGLTRLPLYIVVFELGDLFDEHQGSTDQINVEIWEGFLANAE